MTSADDLTGLDDLIEVFRNAILDQQKRDANNCAILAKVRDIEYRRVQNFRRQLFDIPYYHGILDSDEISQLLKSNSDGYCLIEHKRYVNGFDAGLYLYIHRVNRYFDEKHKFFYSFYIGDNKTIHFNDRFEALSSFIKCELIPHRYTFHNCTSDRLCFDLEKHPIVKNPRRHDQYKPKSLFDSSAFVARNFFYYDRNFVESKLPKTLFHRVFAGATV
jgi:hypothetical protein